MSGQDSPHTSRTRIDRARATTLVACVYDTVEGAIEAVPHVLETAAASDGLVDDAATLCWDERAARPRIESRVELASQNPLGDDFWALVLGLTLRVPLLGAEVGGAAGAGSGSLAAAGIDETFMNRLRDAMTPGRSALLVIGRRSLAELIGDEVPAPLRPDTMSTQISDRQLAALRGAFVP